MTESLRYARGRRVSATGRVTRETVLTVCVALTFAGSFIPYVVGINTATLLVAPVTLVLIAFAGIPMIMPRQFADGLASLRRKRVLLFALILPIFPMTVAAYSGNASSVLYGALMSATLIALRIILTAIGVRGIVNALAGAAAIAVPMFLARYSAATFAALHDGSRLTPSTAQPNAIAFIFSGLVVACFWYIHERYTGAINKLWLGGCAFAALVVIFASSSRASMLALIFAGLWVAAANVCERLRHGMVPRYVAIAGALVIGIILLVCIIDFSIIERIPDEISHVFRLGSSYRGLNSGFSGRTVRWVAALGAITSGLTWLSGYGFRTSEAALGFSIDNGFITLWYECGLVGVMLVVGQLSWLVARCTRGLHHAFLRPIDRGICLVVLLLTLSVLFNSIFDRYLFGLGNPLSLVALSFLLVDTTDLGLMRRGRRGAAGLAAIAEGSD